MRWELGEGAWVELREGFVAGHDSLMSRLVTTLPLESEPILIFGRRVMTPRLTSWHGDDGCAYAYSGRRFSPHPWTPELDRLRRIVTEITGVRFNSVLANFYRTGQDSMGAHADDEKELGPSRDDIRIASVSLGARRRFSIRPKRTRSGPRLDLSLGEGDLLVMGGTTQRDFRHHVPKTRRPVGSRLNLTFRVIMAHKPGGAQ